MADIEDVLKNIAIYILKLVITKGWIIALNISYNDLTQVHKGNIKYPVDSNPLPPILHIGFRILILKN